MRLQELYRKKRREILWCAIGFIACQLVLGLCVEFLWTDVRDPEFTIKETLLKKCVAEAPGRPLILALGSSRTRMGLDSEKLSSMYGDSGPVVFNFGILGAGPLVNRIMLERLLADGIRPQLLLVEVMALQLSDRKGGPIEENGIISTRFTYDEARRIHPRLHSVWRLDGFWSTGRLLPVYRHQSQLRELVQLDVPMPGQPGSDYARGMFPHGWQPHYVEQTPEERAEKTKFALGQYEDAAIDFRLDPYGVEATRDLLAICRRERLPTMLLLMPEGTPFRQLYPESAWRDIEGCLNQLRKEFDTPIIDARTWVPDEGFWDSHHLVLKGAGTFSERLEREVLRPMWQSGYR